MLTPRQRQVILYIQDRTDAGRRPPTYQQIGKKLRIKSKSGVHRLIHSLIERGYLMQPMIYGRTVQIKRVKPQYAAFVFDRKNKTFKRLK